MSFPGTGSLASTTAVSSSARTNRTSSEPRFKRWSSGRVMRGALHLDDRHHLRCDEMEVGEARSDIEPRAKVLPGRVGSLDYFLAERYCLYMLDEKGRLTAHPPPAV